MCDLHILRLISAFRTGDPYSRPNDRLRLGRAGTKSYISIQSHMKYIHFIQDLKSLLPVTPADNMITFTFANGCIATLRGYSPLKLPFS